MFFASRDEALLSEAEEQVEHLQVSQTVVVV